MLAPDERDDVLLMISSMMNEGAFDLFHWHLALYPCLDGPQTSINRNSPPNKFQRTVSHEKHLEKTSIQSHTERREHSIQQFTFVSLFKKCSSSLVERNRCFRRNSLDTLRQREKSMGDSAVLLTIQVNDDEETVNLATISFVSTVDSVFLSQIANEPK